MPFKTSHSLGRESDGLALDGGFHWPMTTRRLSSRVHSSYRQPRNNARRLVSFDTRRFLMTARTLLLTCLMLLPYEDLIQIRRIFLFLANRKRGFDCLQVATHEFLGLCTPPLFEQVDQIIMVM